MDAEKDVGHCPLLPSVQQCSKNSAVQGPLSSGTVSPRHQGLLLLGCRIPLLQGLQGYFYSVGPEAAAKSSARDTINVPGRNDVQIRM